MSLTGFRSDSRLISTCMEGRPSQAILSGSVKRDAYLCQQDWVKSPKFREKCRETERILREEKEGAREGDFPFELSQRPPRYSGLHQTGRVANVICPFSDRF